MRENLRNLCSQHVLIINIIIIIIIILLIWDFFTSVLADGFPKESK